MTEISASIHCDGIVVAIVKHMSPIKGPNGLRLLVTVFVFFICMPIYGMPTSSCTGTFAEDEGPRSAAQRLPNLTDLTIFEAQNLLVDQGIIYRSTTAGGYVKYTHPDGSIVWIRPNLEITRSGPKITFRNENRRGYRPRYNQYGQLIPHDSPEEHQTGEYLIPDP